MGFYSTVAKKTMFYVTFIEPSLYRARTIPKNHQIIEISKEHYVFFLQISEQRQ